MVSKNLIAHGGLLLKTTFCLLMFCVLSGAGVARAQTGCVDSPECPTAVLAGAGACGVAVARRWKR